MSLHMDFFFLKASLNKTGEIKVMLKMSQIIDSDQDKDKRCQNYPNELFDSYNDCDSKFVYKDCKQRFPFMPFGVANELKEVTAKPRYNKFIQRISW